MNPITMKLVVDDLILQALREDITFEDVSTASVCPAARLATVELSAKAECSGNVDANNIRALADLGVDFISSGALTHSAPILDLSLKHLRLLDGK